MSTGGSTEQTRRGGEQHRQTYSCGRLIGNQLYICMYGYLLTDSVRGEVAGPIWYHDSHGIGRQPGTRAVSHVTPLEGGVTYKETRLHAPIHRKHCDQTRCFFVGRTARMFLIRKRISKKNSMASVRKRTIPTKRPPLVGEVTAKFCG
jgi:hypothetical protein